MNFLNFYRIEKYISKKEALDLVFHFLHGLCQRALIIGQDCDGDDVPRDAASPSKIGLLSHVHVWHVLVLAEQWQVQDDLERLRVGGEDDEVGDATVERLGGLVGALLELIEGLGLVDDVQDGLAHLVVCLGPGSALLNGIVIGGWLLWGFDLLGNNRLFLVRIGLLGGLLRLLLLLILFVLLALLLFLVL